MDYTQEYKRFINSHNFSDGVRITIGIALPAIIGAWVHQLDIGLTLAVGAVCASIPDTPGPVHHRRNGLLICTLLAFIATLITGLSSAHLVVLALVVTLQCLLFSMLTVYGNRAANIGTAALLAMVLALEKHSPPHEVWISACYILLGSIWYTLFSLSLHSIRPYLLARQALAECIQETAEYLRIRAAFYEEEISLEPLYEKLVAQQIKVSETQDTVRELLFKSRLIVKESTNTSRILVTVFIDIVDMFERIMAVHQDHTFLHQKFRGTGVLPACKALLLAIADDMSDVSLAMGSKSTVKPARDIPAMIKAVRDKLEALKAERGMNPGSLRDFVTMRNILNNIRDLASRVDNMHQYTAFNNPVPKKNRGDLELTKFIRHNSYGWDVFSSNLTSDSNIFRHALRVSITVLIGLIVSRFLPVGHSYWILLTIIVILKPSYTLTRKRNYERFVGTIAGGIIGALLIYLVKDQAVLFIIMLLCMLGTYSIIRTNYIVGVLIMTPYILLLFNFLSPGNFSIVKDRMIDTCIGSAIAILANSFLLPTWEYRFIRQYETAVLDANTDYFRIVSNAFTGQPFSTTLYKLARKNAYVATANLGGAFQRMLSEPKSKQKNMLQLHGFVLSNHLLSSNIAILASFVIKYNPRYDPAKFNAVIDVITAYLRESSALLKHEIAYPTNIPVPASVSRLQQDILQLTQERLHELESGKTETDIRRQLRELQLITDQFNAILKSSIAIRKQCDILRA